MDNHGLYVGLTAVKTTKENLLMKRHKDDSPNAPVLGEAGKGMTWYAKSQAVSKQKEKAPVKPL